MTAATLLALDPGSPRVSVALRVDGAVVDERGIEQARSSRELLPLVDGVLAAAGLRLSDLGAVAVLRGPGSFTGLRIGLATVEAWRAALGLRVAVLPTLAVLAGYAREHAVDSTVAAVVDALRDEWFLQRFSGPTPEGAPAIVGSAALPGPGTAAVCGYGAGRLAARDGWPKPVPVIEPTALAGTAARLAEAEPSWWDPALLRAPLYLREPAVTPAGRG